MAEIPSDIEAALRALARGEKHTALLTLRQSRRLSAPDAIALMEEWRGKQASSSPTPTIEEGEAIEQAVKEVEAFDELTATILHVLKERGELLSPQALTTSVAAHKCKQIVALVNELAAADLNPSRVLLAYLHIYSSFRDKATGAPEAIDTTEVDKRLDECGVLKMSLRNDLMSLL